MRVAGFEPARASDRQVGYCPVTSKVTAFANFAIPAKVDGLSPRPGSSSQLAGPSSLLPLRSVTQPPSLGGVQGLSLFSLRSLLCFSELCAAPSLLSNRGRLRRTNLGLISLASSAAC